MIRALSFCNYSIRGEIGMKLQKLCMLHAGYPCFPDSGTTNLHLDVSSAVNINVSDVCVGSVQNMYLTGFSLPLTATPPIPFVPSNYRKSIQAI